MIKLATYCSVATALIIIAAKLYGWFITGSLSLMASLIDSSLDIIASLINLLAARYALQPPDNEHRFGHGKAEDLAVFSQSVFFNLSAAFLFASSINRIFNPVQVENSIVGIKIMIFSSILTVLLITFQNYVISKTNSKIVSADKLHYLTDLFTNLAILASLCLGYVFAYDIIDPIFALLISIYIFKCSFDLLRPAFRNLMDHEFPAHEKKLIINIINKHPKIVEFHDMKTRSSGNKPFIQFHLEMSPDLSLLEAYTIAAEIEEKILELKPDAEIMIRKEPAGVRGHIKDYKD